MKIDLQGMEEVRDRVRSTAYLMENIIKEIGGETQMKLQSHIQDLYGFINEITSSNKWSIRSDDDAFDN